MASAVPFKASDHEDGKHHLLLAASGSVATIKIPNIVQSLLSKHRDKLSIRLIFTESSTQFLQGQSSEQPSIKSLAEIPGVDGIYHDSDEWTIPWIRGNPILHIELRRWADVLLIAPLSANTLAKVVNGFSDNLLTSVIRAWDGEGRVDGKAKKIFVAPAMNTAMWDNPITSRQLKALQSEEMGGWFEVLDVAPGKVLACGDIGGGAMKEWTEIVERMERYFGLPS